MEEEIVAQVVKSQYQPVPSFITMIIQLLEMQLVRHGVMIVGFTMRGKSTNSQILAKALTSLRQQGDTDPNFQLTKVFGLNPKSVSMNELYGSFNMNKGEWTDGLFAFLIRGANKIFCLSNGERIKLPPTMTMMFEVNDLAVASPATAPRRGMVNMEPVPTPRLRATHPDLAAGFR